MPPLGRQHIAPQTGFETLLLGQHFFFKAHFVHLKIGLPLLTSAFGLLLYGRFQLLNAVQKFLNFGVHEGS